MRARGRGPPGSFLCADACRAAPRARWARARRRALLLRLGGPVLLLVDAGALELELQPAALVVVALGDDLLRVALADLVVLRRGGRTHVVGVGDLADPF